MSRIDTGFQFRAGRILLALAVGTLFAALAVTAIKMEPGGSAIAARIGHALADAGASNPVTATLLNFRGYDTLLELSVMLVAVLAVRAVCGVRQTTIGGGGPALRFLAAVLIPVMTLVGGYLLYSGSHGAGGAFQAGAVLAAVGIVYVLAGHTVPAYALGLALRLGSIIGVASFLAFGCTSLLIYGSFLEYPQTHAGGIILFLEFGAAMFTAIAFVDLFLHLLAADGSERNGDIPNTASR